MTTNAKKGRKSDAYLIHVCRLSQIVQSLEIIERKQVLSAKISAFISRKIETNTEIFRL